MMSAPCFCICLGSNESLACQCGETANRETGAYRNMRHSLNLLSTSIQLNTQLLEAASCVDFVVVHEVKHTRKRLQDQVLQEDKQPRSAKRRKAALSSGYPPQFWDTLSKVHLTRRALKEIDRRSVQSGSAPVTGATRTATSRRILRSDSRRLEEFAKDGGSDLSALRGVSTLFNWCRRHETC